MKTMNKVFKVIAILLVIAMLSTTLTYVSAYNFAGKITELDGAEGNDTLNSNVSEIVGAIISVTRIIAVGVAIIFLAIVAMKYMSSAPGDRAEIKKHAVIYVVGAVVLFASVGILSIIEQFAGSIG